MASCSNSHSRQCISVDGPVIVGAGPSGLAVAAGLSSQGLPCIVLERANCIASLWQERTYDRLRLHLPKKFCQLPQFPFPANYPEYPSRQQFVDYLEAYACRFDVKPHFNRYVQSATYDDVWRVWRVLAICGDGSEVEYVSEWLVVATGENAEKKPLPDIDGLKDFAGEVIHAVEYKSGEHFRGRKVLVVGCGNTGMEVSLDLCNHHATPSMVVRDTVHVLPRDVFGLSIFQIGMFMMKWCPLWLVDRAVLTLARLALGETDKYGLKRPRLGPFALKQIEGKTPVLDVGAMRRIRAGDIKIVPGISRFSDGGMVEFVDGKSLQFDAVIFATGYRANVGDWLKESEGGDARLYKIGFTGRGLPGLSAEAVKIAGDIAKEMMEKKTDVM